MIETTDPPSSSPTVTDGEIAVVNLDHARQRSWDRLIRDPRAAGAAERIVEEEQIASQFLGDVEALGRLEVLATELGRLDPGSARTALVQAQVASTTHRFAQARRHLADAQRRGAPSESVLRLELNLDQACGTGLDAVLAARRRMAAVSGSLEDLIPLGALLADLRDFDEADRTYRHALQSYRDVSPFALAWGCFQLGMLWGELVAEPDVERAALWYRRAVAFVPAYVKARVHLAEIELQCNRAEEAESLLTPALATGDPEVHWRLGSATAAQGRFDEAEAHLAAARSGYERLLAGHPLAFADHAAEFYADGGYDAGKALALARANVANRPTLRAFEQAHAIALEAGDAVAATELLTAARRAWGATPAFRRSPLGGMGNDA